MFGMSADQLTGQARMFLGFFGGIAAALGWTWYGGISEAFLATIGPVMSAVGPVMGFAAMVWSAVKNKQSNLVTAAANVPGVQGITLQANPAGRALAPVTPSNVNVGTPTASRPL